MRSAKRKEIPIIDVFAGPGGLGEGFSRLRDAVGNHPFHIALSIEKEVFAHHTLLLRSFYRQFDEYDVPDDYYRRLRGEITSEELFARHLAEHAASAHEAWHAELGSPTFPLVEIRARVDQQLSTFRETDRCVLIGGPPCQAYSLVGRSRNKGRKGYRFEDDPKATLYREYLQLIADVWPAVFIMENVKGLLSSQMDGQRIFN